MTQTEIKLLLRIKGWYSLFSLVSVLIQAAVCSFRLHSGVRLMVCQKEHQEQNGEVCMRDVNHLHRL